MQSVKNEHGSVIVFVTLMIVLLLIMVGMGLDTGQLTYTRSQGQAAVDAAALAAVSGLPVDSSEVSQRVAAFNASNDYVKKSSNPIGGANITYIQYNETTGAISKSPVISTANGVRVALEEKNPYTGTTAGTGINTPAFLSPLLNLFGESVPASTDVNVSAVAVLRTLPSVPIALMTKVCSGSTTVTGVKIRDQENTSPDNACWTTYTDPVSTSLVRTLFDASATCSGLPANTDLITSGTTIGLSDSSGNSPNLYTEARDLFLTNSSTRDRWWIVPVVPNSTDCPPTAPIIGWARIKATEVDTSGDKYIRVNLTCDQQLFRASDNLCFSPRLVRDTKSGM